jgi:EmrB/QacA subfamily drug resistance transporter
MDLLDSTIVNVGAPSIARDLQASSTELQWVIAGYTLAMAAALITGGRLGDLYGRRRMFLLGIAGFTLFSALCSAAPDPRLLIAARCLQGLSAAIMLPQGLSIIRAVFPPAQAGAAMGVFGPAMGLAATCGPIVGGALIQANLFGSHWRSIFWVNVPLGLIALACAWRAVPRDQKNHGPDAPTLDVAGMLLSGLGMLLLVYPLIQGRDKNWPLYMFVLMAASVPVFAAFGFQQLSRRRQGRTPLVTPTLFTKRGFSGGLVFATFFFAGMGGLVVVLMLHIQLALGFSSLHAGLTGLPFSLGAAIGTGAGAGLAPKLGRRVLHAGVVLMAAGLGALAWTISTAGQRMTTWDVVPSYAVCGIGMGLLIATYFTLVVAEIDEHETGTAGGVLNAVQQLANSLGVALFGTLYFNGLKAGHTSVTAASSALIYTAVAVAFCVPLGYLLPRFIRPGAEMH